MERCPTSILKAVALSAFFCLAPSVFAAPVAATTPAAAPVTLNAKMFTKDQLAGALDTVVAQINKCDGNTDCLKKIREWNDRAMTQVRNEAVAFKNTKLSLQLICGSKKSTLTSETNADGKFSITPPAQNCVVKGLDPKCGAIEKDKHFPDLKTGETLYCVTGDDTKLKHTTDNLKKAVINSMKNAIAEKAKASDNNADQSKPAQ